MSIDDITELPFVQSTDEGAICMWNAEESGAYALDTKIGRGHADQLIDLMARKDNPTLLGRVVKDMIAGGRYGGVEVGFMHRIADRSIRQSF